MGLPVYKGADLIAKALDCLQRQTFGNFEAIISVDGNDEKTAAACRPFLADPRFRMVVHAERLDWVGNFNWLLRQDIQEIFLLQIRFTEAWLGNNTIISGSLDVDWIRTAHRSSSAAT